MLLTKRYLFSFLAFLLAFTAYSTSYTVISTNSSGPGTFNNAIVLANANSGVDTILFNIPQSGEQIIKLDQLLPSITEGVYIDGQSQNVSRGANLSAHLITLDGQGVQPHGLIFIAGTDFSTVFHLKLKRFIAAGILIDDTFNVAVYSNAFDDNDIAIFINNASFNLVGDGSLKNKNIITKSKTDGIVVVGNSEGNDFNHNSIYGNKDLGIDLGDNINDSRDQGDVDEGPNGFQNRPLIDRVTIEGDSVTFYITHIGLNGILRFDFYSNDTRDTSNSSGQTFLGSKTIGVTDRDKIKQTFKYNSSHRSFSVLATANGNTSEFSNLALKPGLIPPVAMNDTFSIVEDHFSVFNILLNDMDDNLDSSSLVLVGPLSEYGSVEVTNNRISYTPNQNFYGIDSFGYKICDLTDQEPYCDSALVMVTILGEEDSPIAISDSIGTQQASVVVIDIASNDVDAENNIRKNSISIIKSVSTAIISVNNDEIGEIKIDYTLIPSFKGRDTIVYSICDSTGLCDTGFVFIAVNAGSIPVTEKDIVTLLEDEIKTIDVLANDSDADNNLNRSSVTIVKNGVNGIASYNSDLERVIYHPNLNFNGFDTVIYRVCDFTLNCVDDTIYISVAPEDDPPQAIRITAKTVQGNCKNILSIDVLKDIVEPDENDSLDFSSFEIRESISNISPSKDAKGKLVFNYSSVPNFYGLDSIQYKICDTQGLCDSSFVVVDVVFNAKPTVINDKVTIKQGATTLVDVLKNDKDNRIGLDIASLKITATLKNGVSTKSVGGIIQIDYSNNIFFSGTDKLTYEICDSSCLCGTGQLEVTVEDTSMVTSSNMVLIDDVFTFKEGCVSASINILSNDSLKGLADLTTLSLIPFPKNFLWDLNEFGDLVVNYFPDTIFEQKFNINYRLCDTLNNCDTATILVNVIENQPPKTTTIFFTFVENTSSYEIDVLENVIDADGVDLTSLTILKQPNHGSSLVNLKNQVKYNAGMQSSDYESDTILYQICDSSCMCVSDNIVIQFPQKEKIIIYEGFSPNGDGINDVWTIDNLVDYDSSQIQIFNRWGSVVYESESLFHDTLGIWDGQDAPEGVYYYVIKPFNEELESITGTIVLQR